MEQQNPVIDFTDENVVTIRCLSAIPEDVQSLLAQIADEEESEEQ